MRVERRILALAVLAMLAGCSFLKQHGDPVTNIYFLDVGEGSATLVDSPDLGRILIDTGNPSSRIVSKIKALGISTIDKLILTHPHPDHIGGAFSVFEFLDPVQIFDNGEPLLSGHPEERWYLEQLRGARYNKLRAGDLFREGTSELSILSPKTLGSDWNTNSLVMMLTLGSKKILLMADGNFATEAALIKNNTALNADILQIGHHGASDASSQEFLRRVSPAFAVVSVNKDNVNGYPGGDVLKRLAVLGVEVHLTYRDGLARFMITSDTIYYLGPNAR